jgi:hypothetical protein
MSNSSETHFKTTVKARWYFIPSCLIVRPFVAAATAAILAGVLGAFGGLVYGAIHGSLSFAVETGIRLAGAGAVAGFIVGLWSGWDRLTWPIDEWAGWQVPARTQPLVREHLQPPESAAVARDSKSKNSTRLSRLATSRSKVLSSRTGITED